MREKENIFFPLLGLNGLCDLLFPVLCFNFSLTRKNEFNFVFFLSHKVFTRYH